MEMRKKMQEWRRQRSRVTRLVLLLVFGFLYFPVHAQSVAQYPKTREALIDRYRDEVIAHRNYAAFSEKACSEGYPNIAHLFSALAESEGVHARNFKNLLKDLGVDSKDIDIPANDKQVKSTKYNLEHAATVEKDEIDNRYPEILAGIRDEHHDAAITAITYAWEAEKQHRELIVKIKNAAITWFGFLVKRIEGKDAHYFVCQTCGSTLMELEGTACPICGQAMTGYHEVPGFTAKQCPVPDRDDW